MECRLLFVSGIIYEWLIFNNTHSIFFAVWIVFIVMSSLVMLNLVVGVVCSAMAEATQARKDALNRRQMLQQIADKTALPVSLLEGWAKVCLFPFWDVATAILPY